MRRLLFLSAFGWAAAVGGCADIYGLGDYTTEGSRPTSNAANAAPGEEGPSGPSPASVDPKPSCTSNAACGEGSICVRATGRCATPTAGGCRVVAGDAMAEGAVLLGAVVGEPLERAAVLAVEEIAAASPGRPLALVACDASDPAAAAKLLAEDLRVPAIIGPLEAEDVLDVTQQITAKAKTLVMTPTSLASVISNLADDDLTWRAAPSDAQRAGLVIAQMSALEDVLRTTRGTTTVKLGIVHRTDALGTSARDAISGKLIINGRFINDAANADNVSIDAYGRSDDAALEAVAARYASTFKPDVVFVTAPEQVDHLLVPLEQALAAARAVYRPYYVCTEAAKTKALLDAVAAPGAALDLRRRIRGVAATSDTTSAPVFAAFKSRFTARFGDAPESFATSATYDATYAIAYALAASKEPAPDGATVARGLRAFGAGAAVAVGPNDAAAAMKSLEGGKSVALLGTNTLLQWDVKGDMAGGTVEVWCVGAGGGSPAFGSSGLSMDVATQVVGGAFVQCQ